MSRPAQEGVFPDRKHIVICADDFGIDPAADEAILQLAGLGRLNATSCLAEGPGFAGHASALRASGLQLGLHLNFTESIGGTVVHMPVSALILKAWLRRLPTAQVDAQIARQLDAFEAALGGPPDFVDGHQHVHQFPVIRDALLRTLAQRYGGRLPWLRYTRMGQMNGVPLGLRFKAGIIGLLGARAFAGRARGMGFRMNRRFLGVYDFQGGRTAYAGLLQSWLAGAEDGDLMMCHPATRTIPGDEVGKQRRAEFDVLKSDEMAEWLAVNRLSLGSDPKWGLTP